MRKTVLGDYRYVQEHSRILNTNDALIDACHKAASALYGYESWPQEYRDAVSKALGLLADAGGFGDRKPVTRRCKPDKSILVGLLKGHISDCWFLTQTEHADYLRQTVGKPMFYKNIADATLRVKNWPEWKRKSLY